MIKASLIIPCYNERSTIGLLLTALSNQTFPSAEMEIIIADGMSSDGTRQVIESFQTAHPELPVRVVDNPQRIIPAALNRALAVAQGEFIVRMDAHAVPQPDYVERCVHALQAGHGENVGGIWEIRPGRETWIARSIAVAAAHPLGVGDARYRVGGTPQVVDTVPFGAFRRSLAVEIGFFDESLLTNEDYEFNTRIRQAGGKVWFDPAIRMTYFARANIAALARQYWRYGYWKLRMLRRYPETIRWRQALPPLFVLVLMGLGLLSLVWPGFGLLLALGLGVYGVVLGLAGVHAAWRRADAGLAAGLPLAIATMHIAWGAAFLWSLVSLPFGGNRR